MALIDPPASVRLCLNGTAGIGDRIFRTDDLAVGTLEAKGRIDFSFFIFDTYPDRLGRTNFLTELTANTLVLIYPMREDGMLAKDFLQGSKWADQVVKHCWFVPECNEYRGDQPEQENGYVFL